MSYPILYSATEKDFDHNGIGILSACVSCEVTEEANGIFELAMQYPMDGVHFAEIGDRSIIKAKADQFRDAQLFRVYAISKPMNGIVTVLAEHISYDLSGIPVKPFSADNATSALDGLKENAVITCPFDFWTDKKVASLFTVSHPASIRSRLGGVAGSILDVYAGEYEFDNFTVKLHTRRGLNRGVSIRYGKNLTDIQQEQNCASVATGVYPYWFGDVDGTSVLVELPEKIVNAPGTYNFVKIKTVDFTESFETQPTEDQLRQKAERYVNANKIGVPDVSLTVSFAQLEQSSEYKHLNLLERVGLFDTVNVEFPALNVSATAKAVKIVYDSISDRVKSVTLGSVRASIADTIADQQKEIETSKEKPTVSLVQKISSAIAKSIIGAKGGTVRLIDTNGDGEPDELYIADNPDPSQAVKVWRFNHNGWAASKNGYLGPFEMGATLESGLLANFVTAANLVAGTIKSQDDGKSFYLDLDHGILNMNATSLKVAGKTVNDVAKEELSKETSEDVFKKLTNNGEIQGIYLVDGKWYINAEIAKIYNLFTQNVSVSGQFLGSGSAFLEPGWQELEEINRFVFENENPTEEDIYLFDFNEDGKIDIIDYRLALDAARGKGSVANWSNAKKTNISVYINPSNPKKTIQIIGDNMWGRTVDIYLGTGALFNGENADKNFTMMLEFDPLYQSLSSDRDDLISKTDSLEQNFLSLSEYVYDILANRISSLESLASELAERVSELENK